MRSTTSTLTRSLDDSPPRRLRALPPPSQQSLTIRERTKMLSTNSYIDNIPPSPSSAQNSRHQQHPLRFYPPSSGRHYQQHPHSHDGYNQRLTTSDRFAAADEEDDDEEETLTDHRHHHHHHHHSPASRFSPPPKLTPAPLPPPRIYPPRSSTSSTSHPAFPPTRSPPRSPSPISSICSTTSNEATTPSTLPNAEDSPSLAAARASLLSEEPGEGIKIRRLQEWVRDYHFVVGRVREVCFVGGVAGDGDSEGEGRGEADGRGREVDGERGWRGRRRKKKAVERVRREVERVELGPGSVVFGGGGGRGGRCEFRRGGRMRGRESEERDGDCGGGIVMFLAGKEEGNRVMRAGEGYGGRELRLLERGRGSEDDDLSIVSRRAEYGSGYRRER